MSLGRLAEVAIEAREPCCEAEGKFLGGDRWISKKADAKPLSVQLQFRPQRSTSAARTTALIIYRSLFPTHNEKSTRLLEDEPTLRVGSTSKKQKKRPSRDSNAQPQSRTEYGYSIGGPRATIAPKGPSSCLVLT